MAYKTRVFVLEEIREMRDRITAVIRGTASLQLAGQDSNVVDAIARITTLQPDIILVDADLPNIDNTETIKKILEAVPDINIICTSRQWNEAAVRMAVLAGAKGYLVKPFSEEELLEAERSLDELKLSEMQQAPLGKVITLFSPKGGCGKTTLAANLAVGLAQKTGLNIAVADADLEFGGISVFYNLFPVVNFVDAARDIEELSPVDLMPYMTRYSPLIKVLAAADKPEQAELVSGRHIEKLLHMMRRLFSYIIVDTAPGFQEVSRAAIKAADEVYVVAALNSGLEIEHVRSSLECFKAMGYKEDKVKVIFSRVKQRDLETIKQLEKDVSFPITALLPNDFRLAATAVNSGVPLVTRKADAPLAKSILALTEELAAKISQGVM